jgi:SpoVK/Ycf46/Vps4 family AAA+-type ATPase
MTRKLSLESSVNLYDWAKRLVGYTGADIQGFIGTAHLEAVHDHLTTIDKDIKPEIKKERKEPMFYIEEKGSKRAAAELDLEERQCIITKVSPSPFHTTF